MKGGVKKRKRKYQIMVAPTQKENKNQTVQTYTIHYEYVLGIIPGW